MNLENSKIIPLLQSIENAKRENRDFVANIVFQNQGLHEDLVKTVFFIDNKISVRAAWVLEWICTHYGLNFIIPSLDYFTEHIKKLQYDSSIRPCAKICEHISIAYSSKEENLIKKTLTETHKKRIIEAGFDWLITSQKIAVRAYTMTTLYLLGKEKEWVHPELEHLIQTKIIHESKGCKARGKKVLELIQKHQKSGK